MEWFRQHKWLVDNFLVDVDTVLINLVGIINCLANNCCTILHFGMLSNNMITPRTIIAYHSYTIFIKAIDDVHDVLCNTYLNFVNSKDDLAGSFEWER